MGRHKSNHIQVVYAPNESAAYRAYEQSRGHAGVESGNAHSVYSLFAEELFQVFAGGIFARVAVRLAGPGAADEIEVFAEVGHVLFRHGIGAPLAALVGRARVVT